jgi:hypothetical protein
MPDGTRRKSGDGVAGVEGGSAESLKFCIATFLASALSEWLLAKDPLKEDSEAWRRRGEAVSEGVVGATDEPAVDKAGLVNEAAPKGDAVLPLALNRKFGSASGQSIAQVSLQSIVISERIRSFK